MRHLSLFALLALAGCSAQPVRWSGFVEAGAGAQLSTPADAGPRDIRDVQNPRAVLAGGVCVRVNVRLELTGSIRHESGATVYDYGQSGAYVTARYYLFGRD